MIITAGLCVITGNLIINVLPMQMSEH